MSQISTCIENKSNTYLSAVKAIATILVVYVHSENIFRYADYTGLASLRRVISTFNAAAVPVFFIISGYLLFRNNFDYKTNISKKIRTLLIPFLVWNTIWFFLEIAVSYLIPNYWKSFDFTIQGLLNVYWGIPMGGIPPIYAPLWFVRDLFALNVLSFVIKSVFNHCNRWIIVVALLALWLSTVNNQARQSICFFCLGGLAGYYKPKFECKKPIMFATLFSILGLLISLSSTNKYVNRIATLFFIIAILMWLSLCTYTHRTLNKLMPYSFAIYVMHGKLISVLQIVLVKLIPQNSYVIILEYLIVPLFVIALCIFGTILLRHVAPAFFSIAMGNRFERKKE